MSGPLDTLISALKRFPGVGEKTATRYAFYILNERENEIQDLIDSIRDVKQKLRLCSTCYNLTDRDPCEICSNRKREKSRILVVETPLDLIAVENSRIYFGIYHVLHGVLSPLDAIGPEDIRLAELIDRAHSGRIKEIILALNPTVEGEATATYIRDQLQNASVKVSRIAFGIPIGGTLEYADPLSLSMALDNRKEL
ncbi:MAG: recombination mediator RecR [Desulfomonilaceae bacterium]